MKRRFTINWANLTLILTLRTLIRTLILTYTILTLSKVDDIRLFKYILSIDAIHVFDGWDRVEVSH